MNNGYLSKLREATISILPIMLIVLILASFVVELSSFMILQFLIACVLLIFGMSCFTLGSDEAMIPIGENIGSFLSKTNRVWFMLFVGFLMGVVITIAEPDLLVLANLVPAISTWKVMLAVGLGVGVFMIFAILRILLRIPLNVVLLISYATIFILSFFVPPEFAPLSFDGGSVTTGPISVPFLMAFGLGLASVRGNAKADSDDSFGYVALGSAGPIIAVMILGLMVDCSTLTNTTTQNVVAPSDINGVLNSFLECLPHTLFEVGIVVLPILVIFMLFEVFLLKLPIKKVVKILLGLVFVYVGIVLFFTGVSVGFLPVGSILGEALAGSVWLFVPVSCLLGFVIVLAEPAVHVLANQVEQLTEGRIPSKTILVCMCIGVSLSLGLCALRVVFEFSIWWVLIPAYVIALILAFVVPHIFTGIAFDSGGVATGAMATTFVLPLVLGACACVGADSMLYAFGTLAFMCVSPLITIQVLGLIVKIVNARKVKKENKLVDKDVRIEIVEFD